MKKLIERMRDNKRFELIVYSSVILIIAIIFVLSGGISCDRSESKSQAASRDENVKSVGSEEELEKRLESILSRIDGVGSISVMVTVDEGTNEVRGVIVVAEGAREPRVKTELLNAVITVLDAEPERVKVFSMK